MRRNPKVAWRLYDKALKRVGSFYLHFGSRGMQAGKFARAVRCHLEFYRPKEYLLAGLAAVEIEQMVNRLQVRWRDWLLRKQMGLLGH